MKQIQVSLFQLHNEYFLLFISFNKSIIKSREMIRKNTQKRVNRVKCKVFYSKFETSDKK